MKMSAEARALVLRADGHDHPPADIGYANDVVPTLVAPERLATLTQEQFDALCIELFKLGLAGLKNSELLAGINAGEGET